MSHEIFKRCPLCGKQWLSLESFVEDEEINVNGYMAMFDDPEKGLILVTHRVPHCGTTLAVQAALLKPFYEGPFYSESKAGLEQCRRLCLARHALEECDQPCALAWVRAVLQYLRRHELPSASSCA